MIKSGGYQTGMTYDWYRKCGHGKLSAMFMLIPSAWIYNAAIVVMVLLLIELCVWGSR